MKNKLVNLKKRIISNGDSKVLASNFFFMMLLQVAGYIFPLVTIPYLARVIGVDGFGKIAFASAIVVWFQTISDWGFNYTATRDVAKNRDNPEKVSEIFSNVLWARIFLMLLSLGVLLLITSFIPYLKENQLIILLTFLLVPGHIMFPEWFFQAMERMKFITILSLIIKTFFMVMVFVLIKEKEDYILQPIIMSAGYLISGLIAMYLIVVKWQVRLKAPNPKETILTIKSSTDVFITNIMPNLYYGFSTLLVGFFSGAASNGILDAGRKFVGVCEQFLNVISRVFYPYLARHSNKHNLYTKINLSISVLASIVLIVGAPLIIKIFFTYEFYSAIVVLQISALSLIFLSLRNIYGVNFLILRGYEEISRNIIVFTSIFGFILAFPLVYFYDYIGAAITAVTIHAIQGFWMMYAAKKIVPSGDEN